MQQGSVHDAQNAFDQALQCARSFQMRFLSSVMKSLSFSKVTYQTFSYPFRRLLRKKLYQRRGNWKIVKASDPIQPTDSNIENFLRQNSSSNRPLVSVIISTHNGESRLKTTLPSHFKQTAPSNSYEIILVDNASSDKTREFVMSLTQANSQLKYIFEKNLGLHNARHAGARAAKGEILVFTDDDATVDPNWVHSYLEAFRNHPLMNAAGGPVEPEWEQTPEPWLTNIVSDGKFFPALGLMKPFSHFRLTPDCFFFGVNMAIKKHLLFELSGFNPESFGDKWLGDGESGLLRKLWQNGKHIGFVPEAKVHHHIPKRRMTLAYLKHWSRNWGASDAYTKYSQSMPDATRLFGDLITLFLGFPKMFYVWIRHSGQRDSLSIHRIMWNSYTRERICYIWRLLTSNEFRKFVDHKDWLNNPPVEVSPKQTT
jgi:glycosyltransferase involved in cell wall biosynthesis